MLALQIWPCHVTQEANFKKIYFFLILHLILDKAAKFLVEKLSTSEVISQKPHWGGKHPPPSAFRVNKIMIISSLDLGHKKLDFGEEKHPEICH